MGGWLGARRELCHELAMLLRARGVLRDVGWAGSPAGSGGQSWEVTDVPSLRLNLVGSKGDSGDTGYSQGAGSGLEQRGQAFVTGTRGGALGQ